MPSKRPKPTLRQETLAIYSDPHVYCMAEAASRCLGRGPDHSGYGRDLTMLLVDLEARVHHNRLACDRANRDTAFWQLKRRQVRRMTGRDLLLPTPPREAHVRRWRHQLVPVPKAQELEKAVAEGFYENLPPHLTTLSDLFTELGANRARELGHFPTGVANAFTRPRRRHVMILDGTYLSPHSFARCWTDPDGVTHRPGSRAKSKETVRQQAYINGETKNQHKYMGVNHVVAITPTRYGRVVLGLTRALHGEPAAAVHVIEKALAHLGDGLHCVLYDKGLEEWAQEYLLAVHGILPVVPPKRKRAKDDEVEALKLDAAAAIRRTLPPPKRRSGQERSAGAKDRRPVAKELSGAMADHHMSTKYNVEKLTKLFKQGIALGAGLRVGQSQYLNSQNRVVQTRSKHHPFDDCVHTLPDGTECRHLLEVDDSALWEVAATTRGVVKVQRVRVGSSYPEPDGDQHLVVINHELACRHTGELLPISTRFKPSPTRGPGGTNGRTPGERALAALRPLAPCELGFRKLYGKRSEIESWFEFMKQRLLDGKRAASLDVNHQFLDVLYVGLISNALALRNRRLECE